MDENVIEQRTEKYGKEIRHMEQYKKEQERLPESYCCLEEGMPSSFFAVQSVRVPDVCIRALDSN